MVSGAWSSAGHPGWSSDGLILDGSAAVSPPRIVSLPTGAVLVQLCGELDLAVESMLRDHFTSAVRLSPHLLVDMRQVEFIDCAGLGALIWGRQRALSEGGSFALVAPPAPVRRLLHLAGVEQVFPAHEDLQCAVAWA